MKFIAVFHTWWMDTKGFFVEQYEAGSEEDAHTMARSTAYKNASQFKHVAYHLMQVKKEEELSKVKKLTLKERLTGEAITYK